MVPTESQGKQKPEDQVQENPAVEEEEISEEAWDNFDDLLDKALGTEKEEPLAQQAG